MYRGKYVVRGEEVYCTFGSILQQLKMPADHGCFSKGKPLMHKLDCVVGKNIPSFGRCNFTGLPCVPQPADEWVNPHPRSYIDGERALMTTSILLCFTGPPGIIKFLNNGQAAMVDASKYGRIEPFDEKGTIKVVIKGEDSYWSQHLKFKPGEYVFIDGVYYIDERKLEALKSEVERKDKQLKNNAMIGVGMSNIIGGAYRVGAKAIKVGNAVIRGRKTVASGRHLDNVPRLDRVEVQFRRNPKHDSAEFARQLQAQEDGLNRLTVDEYLKNRKRYIAEGRALESNAAQQFAREQAYISKLDELRDSGLSKKEAEIQAKKWINTQASLHNPDQVAGGNPSIVSDIGDARINSSLGSQWKYRIDDVDEQIREMAKNMTPEQLQTTLLNVRLTQ